ncbi:hypothetical protein B0J11DRAFT_115282 [Dendryphion nanum]|uniref:Uncharacterized protein n=1 Tax=Dendryphion nanum TaxID=256645 RepID=A0A9P9IDP6_9PLEO|nr:hypothetical protein B0J11DRAFT_115282 [Dendryphion nanum]
MGTESGRCRCEWLRRGKLAMLCDGCLRSDAFNGGLLPPCCHSVLPLPLSSLPLLSSGPANWDLSFSSFNQSLRSAATRPYFQYKRSSSINSLSYIIHHTPPNLLHPGLSLSSLSSSSSPSPSSFYIVQESAAVSPSIVKGSSAVLAHHLPLALHCHHGSIIAVASDASKFFLTTTTTTATYLHTPSVGTIYLFRPRLHLFSLRSAHLPPISGPVPLRCCCCCSGCYCCCRTQASPHSFTSCWLFGSRASPPLPSSCASQVAVCSSVVPGLRCTALPRFYHCRTLARPRQPIPSFAPGLQVFTIRPCSAAPASV